MTSKYPKSKSGTITISEDTPRGKSWFLGIGIDDYEIHRKLVNAVKDVRDISELLSSRYDIDPDCMSFLFDKDATEDNIEGELSKLADKVGPNDKLIIYFSGHGHVNKKKGAWIPWISKKEIEENEPKYRIELKYLRNATLKDRIEDINSRHTLVISDACFSGTFIRRSGGDQNLAIDDLEKRSSRYVLTSGRDDEEVSDGTPGMNSPFAESLLRALESNKQRKINLLKLADNVMKETRTIADQLPDVAELNIRGHDRGQYIFELKRNEKDDWIRYSELNTIEGFTEYLSIYPRGEHVDQARNILFHLQDEADWKKANETNTIAAYQQYYKKRDGKHVVEALAQIRILEEEHLWEKALQRDLLSSYLDYSRIYPDGKYRDFAQQKITKLNLETGGPKIVDDPVDKYDVAQDHPSKKTEIHKVSSTPGLTPEEIVVPGAEEVTKNETTEWYSISEFSNDSRLDVYKFFCISLFLMNVISGYTYNDLIDSQITQAMSVPLYTWHMIAFATAFLGGGLFIYRQSRDFSQTIRQLLLTAIIVCIVGLFLQILPMDSMNMRIISMVILSVSNGIFWSASLTSILLLYDQNRSTQFIRLAIIIAIGIVANVLDDLILNDLDQWIDNGSIITISVFLIITFFLGFIVFVFKPPKIVLNGEHDNSRDSVRNISIKHLLTLSVLVLLVTILSQSLTTKFNLLLIGTPQNETVTYQTFLGIYIIPGLVGLIFLPQIMSKYDYKIFSFFISILIFGMMIWHIATPISDTGMENYQIQTFIIFFLMSIAYPLIYWFAWSYSNRLNFLVVSLLFAFAFIAELLLPGGLFTDIETANLTGLIAAIIMVVIIGIAAIKNIREYLSANRKLS